LGTGNLIEERVFGPLLSFYTLVGGEGIITVNAGQKTRTLVRLWRKGIVVPSPFEIS